MKIEKYNPEKYEESSQKFVNFWLSDREILGTWRHKSNPRAEDYLFFKGENGKVRVAVVCHKDSGYKPCFFGDLNHFITVIWVGVTKLQKFWQSCFWYDPRNTRRIQRVLEHTFGVKIK